MSKYYIVGNRAFEDEEKAKTYCNDNDFSFDMIIKTIATNRKSKFYELQTKSNMFSSAIYHNTFLTEEELQEQKWIEEIAHFKSGEYTESFIHLKEISEREYLQHKTT